MNKWPVNGFIPVMLTPYYEDGSIDFRSLEQLTQWYIDNGSVALFANCLSSEMFELSEEEAIACIQTIMKVNAGRLPILAVGTVSEDLAEMVHFSKKLVANGVDIIVLLTNLFVKEEESEGQLIEQLKKYLALFPDTPVGVYECPVPYKRLLTQETLSYLLSTNRLVYHKDTSLDLDQVKERIDVAKGYNFGLYDAYLGNARESLRAGAAGLSCIQGNYFPKLVAWLCENASSPKAVQVEGFFWKHFSLMHRAYPIAAKYMLNKQGFEICTTTRRQVDQLTPEIQKNLDQLFEEYENLFSGLF